MSYNCGGIYFKTQKAITEHIRGILASGQGVPFALSGTVLDFVEDLLCRYHPDWGKKVGCGISAIWIKTNRFGKRGFYITRTDGTETDFSFMKCLAKRSALGDFKKAARNAVEAEITNAESSYFDSTNDPRCPVTQQRLSFGKSIVHHMEPMFDTLVSEFIRAYAINIDLVEYKTGIDGHEGAEFTSNDLADYWRDYHIEHSNLLVVSQEGHKIIHLEKGTIPCQK
jgi:hypothetical protein